jgi:hypothetical protein
MLLVEQMKNMTELEIGIQMTLILTTVTVMTVPHTGVN